MKILLFLIGLWTVPLHGATVSFLVMETGLKNQEAVEFSTVWENSLMDVFFEGGHIVSNAPLLRLYSPPGTQLAAREIIPVAAAESFDDARQGGADFFVLALLDYEGSAGGSPRTPQVSLRLFRVRPREFLTEQGSPGGALRSAREEGEIAKNTARKLIGSFRNFD